MDKHEIVTGILENVDLAARRCHLCPSEAIADMVEASVEIDKVVSTLSGVPFAAPPGGESGFPAARFHLVSVGENIRGFQLFSADSRELNVLEGVLRATRELRLAVEDAVPPRL